MTTDRLVAFTDGVIAILITIMVLELKPPAGTGIGDLHTVVPKLLAYLLSFVLVGIYWINHHHLFHVVEKIDGAVLWSNMALLFSLSLVSLATAWFGEHPGSTGPVFWYAIVQLLCAISYTLMTISLLRLHDPESRLAKAIGDDRKGKWSMLAYVVSVPISLVAPAITVAIIAGVAIAWFVPDRRVSRVLD